MREVVQAVYKGSVRITHCGAPDTFFSRPAKTRFAGRKVFGFVSKNEYDVLVFTAVEDQIEGKKAYRLSLRE